MSVFGAVASDPERDLDPVLNRPEPNLTKKVRIRNTDVRWQILYEG
jgi:hypothetical protein